MGSSSAGLNAEGETWLALPVAKLPLLFGSRWLHHMTAFFAGAQVFTGIEMLEVREEVGFDVLQLKNGLVQLVVAGIAEPHQAVVEALASANALDDQTH